MRLAPTSIPAPHLLAGALCAGLAASVGVRSTTTWLALVALTFAAVGVLLARFRLPLLAAALLVTGWWWGSLRLAELDESPLSSAIGASAYFRAEVTGPTRTSPYTLRTPVVVKRFDGHGVNEPAQLELPAGQRAPPQGAVIELAARVRRPKGPEGADTFDEEAYLRRRGMHVVLRADFYRVVGVRGGVGGVADRIRAALTRSIAPGLEGERRALVAGVVLGEDEGLDAGLRDRFRASGLYHLLCEAQLSLRGGGR